MGAMYLRGYSVECLLKVGLLQKYGEMTLELLARKLAKEPVEIATHSLQRLALLLDFTADASSAKVFTWDPQWRYSPKAASRKECQAFFDAASKFERRLLNHI